MGMGAERIKWFIGMGDLMLSEYIFMKNMI